VALGWAAQQMSGGIENGVFAEIRGNEIGGFCCALIGGCDAFGVAIDRSSDSGLDTFSIRGDGAADSGGEGPAGPYCVSGV